MLRVLGVDSLRSLWCLGQIDVSRSTLEAIKCRLSLVLTIRFVRSWVLDDIRLARDHSFCGCIVLCCVTCVEV
jgi:hypothetical protein